jgi:hypothetical protein
VWAPADPATQSFAVVRGRPALAGWTAKKGVLGLTATTDARGDATCTATIGVVNALTQSSYVAAFAGSDVLEPATATAPLS